VTASDLERLFWEEIDGPSKGREERVEALVSRRPGSEQQLASLRQLAESLAEVEHVAPPPELRAQVCRAIASREPYGGSAPPSAGWVARWLAIGWQPRLAWATLGALIGVFGYLLVAGGGSSLTESDSARLSGALNVGSVAPAEPSPMVLGNSAGAVRLSRTGDNLVATLLPPTGQVLALTLDLEGGELELVRIDGIGASRHEIEARGSEVRLLANGSASLVLGTGGGGTQTLAVRLETAAGESLLERQVELTNLPGRD
jgi:hypothetical protein